MKFQELAFFWELGEEKNMCSKRGVGRFLQEYFLHLFACRFFLEGVKVQSGSFRSSKAKLRRESEQDKFAQRFVSVENLY